MEDGRVISGIDLDSPMIKGRKESMKSDGPATIEGSQEQELAMARESNLVNYATNGDESHLRSTIFISGKDQKYKLGDNRGK